MGRSCDPQVVEIGDGLSGSTLCQLTGGDHPAPGGQNFDIDEVRREERLSGEALAGRLAINPVIGESRDNYARVGNDHRESRSARIACAALAKSALPSVC